MIISTKRGTPQEELQKIVAEFEAQGLEVTLIRGTDYNVFGLVGDTTKINEKVVAANPWVDSVTRVSAPYKKANRLFHEADTVVDVAGVKVGGRDVRVESIQHVFAELEKIAATGEVGETYRYLDVRE